MTCNKKHFNRLSTPNKSLLAKTNTKEIFLPSTEQTTGLEKPWSRPSRSNLLARSRVVRREASLNSGEYFKPKMDNGTTVTAPQSVAEVEQLVKRLYKPGPATLATQIADQLQQLQLSQDGWKLADELMASDDANVRFFAALTFTVKLNNDGSVSDLELSPR